MNVKFVRNMKSIIQLTKVLIGLITLTRTLTTCFYFTVIKNMTYNHVIIFYYAFPCSLETPGNIESFLRICRRSTETYLIEFVSGLYSKSIHSQTRKRSFDRPQNSHNTNILRDYNNFLRRCVSDTARIAVVYLL